MMSLNCRTNTCTDDSSRVGMTQSQGCSDQVKLLRWLPLRHEITRINAAPLHDGIGSDSQLSPLGIWLRGFLNDNAGGKSHEAQR